MNKEERNQYLFENLQRHYDYVKGLGYDILYIAIQGSPNYELDIYTDKYKSDVDTKAIILPSIDDFVKATPLVSTTIILPNDEHCDVKDIRVMFENFKKQNINFLEILFSEWNMINSDYADEFLPILRSREGIARMNFNQALRCMAGMSKEKLNALEHPYPNCISDINQFGYSRKQLHHIVRMNDFIKKFVDGRTYAECLIPDDKEYLLNIKVNSMSLDEARKLAIATDTETYEIKQFASLPTDNINEDVVKLLEDVKYEILKKKIIKEALNGIDENNYLGGIYNVR